MEIYLRRRLNKKVWSTTLSLTVEGLRKFEKVSFRKLTAIQYTCPRKPIHPTCPSTVTINLSLLPQLSAINSATIPYAPIPAITHRGAVAIRNLPSNKKERKRERKERNVGRIIPWTKLGARFRGIVRGMDPLEGESWSSVVDWGKKGEPAGRGGGGGRYREAEIAMLQRCPCASRPKVNSANVRATTEYRCSVPFAASFPWVMVNYGCLISAGLGPRLPSPGCRGQG